MRISSCTSHHIVHQSESQEVTGKCKNLRLMRLILEVNTRLAGLCPSVDQGRIAIRARELRCKWAWQDTERNRSASRGSRATSRGETEGSHTACSLKVNSSTLQCSPPPAESWQGGSAGVGHLLGVEADCKAPLRALPFCCHARGPTGP